MSHVLAVDPSVELPGAALFLDGVLVSARRVPVPAGGAALDRGQRAKQVARAIVAWAVDEGMQRVSDVIYEWPQVYTRDKSRGDPNDLIGLAAVGGEVSGLVSLAMHQLGLEVATQAPTPAEWIGQLPKVKRGDPWASPRGLKIRSRLSAEEFRCVVPSHDAVDAVGLGLHLLGRLGRRRVFHGATPG